MGQRKKPTTVCWKDINFFLTTALAT